ncbi:MAG: T9SS type A sorting domain-containing protein, partial [Chitinophagales bacterium]
SSSNTTVATVVSSTGVVSGVSGGTAAIFYTTIPGCVATKTITVNPIKPVTGVTTVCAGFTTTLSDGVTGGTWSSSNNGLATVVATTGVVTGVSAGTPTISYTMPSGCVKSVPVTICVGRAIDTTNTGTSINSTAATISDIRIFPNPNKGTFTIKGSLGIPVAIGNGEEVTVEIRDVLGQVIYKKKVMSQNGNINELIQLDNTVANSMYIVNVRLGTENKMFHIVIEQ